MLPTLDYKRILLAIFLFAISVAMIYGIIWLVFIRSTGEVTPGDNQPVGGGNLPGAGGSGGINIQGLGGKLPGSITTGGQGEGDTDGAQIEIDDVARGSLTKVSGFIDGEVRGLAKISNGFNYLSTKDNKFYFISSNGEVLPLSQEEFPFVDKVIWSPDGDRVILQYPDGATISYDFVTNKTATLPRGMEDPSFDPSSNNIVYKFTSGNADDNWLVVSDTINSKAEAIEPIGDQGDKVEVAWSPNNQMVALYRKPIGLEKEEIFPVGLSGENFKSFVVDGHNFSGIWSPKGDRIIYNIVTSENNNNPMLWTVDIGSNISGQNNFNLGITTWSEKCTFSNDNKIVYCAVPINLPEGAGLYPELLNTSEDVFYQINLETGISKMIAYPTLSANLEKFQAQRLFVSDDNSKLYFWDNFTGKVYYMKLK
ncbi:hypothetical protein GYA54_00580 [Candidatus Kuenenbacteria bacterium]|nr:hypothetical protein [Candidatus Kuenenbacteria bacterium]